MAVQNRPASDKIPVRQDYELIIQKKSREIQELFEQEAYLHFENPVNHS